MKTSKSKTARRNRQIAELVVKGYTASAIAEKLRIPVARVYNTCRYHDIKLVSPKTLPLNVHQLRTGKYEAQMYAMHERFCLGSFETPQRASIAARLWKHWVQVGYKPWKIPLAPKTRDAV